MNERIDHTYLAPTCSEHTVSRICQEAIDHGFYAVCIPPYFVSAAVKMLAGSPVKVATVIAYPYGYVETPIKVQEVRRALDEGADEVDVVVNLAAVKSGAWNYVTQDLTTVATAARLKGKVCKIIIEVTELTDEERGELIRICNEISPTYVKTSTGIRGGATVADVADLRARLRPQIKIKASGGIRDLPAATALIAAGADRIGTSAGLAIAAATRV